MRKWIVCFLLTAMLLSIAAPVCATQGADVVISTAEEFLIFAENCRMDSYSQGLTVSLAADIDLSGTGFSGVPIFCGTFLGNGHTVSGLEITGQGSQQGLFRMLSMSSAVKNLTVSGTVTPGGSRANVGGIVGTNEGVIENCVFRGSVCGTSNVGGIAGVNCVSGVVKGCAVEGELHGSHFVGGIVGENIGIVDSCENYAAVNTTEQHNSVDISDITIDTLTGTESAATVTDIGGIAGASTGTVRHCVNHADVGYKHMGYNIGGITGSHSGYLVNCENFGDIAGRKEIGGIVGHMEPSIQIRYETDTLQLLRVEVETLSGLTDRAVSNAQGNIYAVENQLMNLEKQVAAIEEALNTLTFDPDSPTLDADVYLAALETLRGVTEIGDTVRQIYASLREVGSDLGRDLQAIAAQVEAIESLLEEGEQTLGGTLLDVSDQDTDQTLTGKIENARNHGAVLGDLNVGGIVGAMGVENDLDPEEDVTVYGSATLNAAGQLRSVILDSVNTGTVTATKRTAGGIVGWQSMGLVNNSVNTGNVSSGDYSGGIAGQSLGYIRACGAKCAVEGKAYVGGIAGSGTVVTDCRSLVTLSGQERVGAILGSAEEDNYTQQEQPLSANLYACPASDPGGVDGISYDGKAQPVRMEEFLKLSGLPRQFQTVCVTFRFADGTSQIIECTPGESIAADRVPEVPALHGFDGYWEGLESEDLNHVLFDVTFEAAYIAHSATVASEQVSGSKPIVLLQGDFVPGSQVAVAQGTALPILAEGETVLDHWQLVISGCEELTGIRLLLPTGGEEETLRLYVHNADGSWRGTEFTLDGSYLVLAARTGDDAVTVVRVESSSIPWGYVAAGAGVLALAATGIIVGRLKKKGKKTEDTQDTSEEKTE